MNPSGMGLTSMELTPGFVSSSMRRHFECCRFEHGSESFQLNTMTAVQKTSRSKRFEVSTSRVEGLGQYGFKYKKGRPWIEFLRVQLCSQTGPLS